MRGKPCLDEYVTQVEDQPNQVDRMREAVSVIAEMRDSDRLRKFLETGSDRA
jgi:ubiquitin carboxyl-terminal hydrolase 25/28